jgi:type III restriction enzyme
MVDEINPGSDFVRFANGTELRSGEAVGADKDALFEAQVRYTIEEHFRKQTRLRARGLKVLSLFFIDRVASYADDDGFIRTTFERLFTELKGAHDDWKDISVENVHAGYFSQQRRKTGETDFIESSGDESDRSAYDLIMKNKERLLSFEEQVSFIFSHSALREGWDSPNVFQLCTLNQTASELKKRQEVGRGMRLPVDQDGERQTDISSAVLTVVANESYEGYVTGLQQEIEGEYGASGTPPAPGNARKRGFANLDKSRQLSPEFKELWSRIKHRTRYSVEIDPKQLVTDAVTDLNGLSVKKPRVTITKAQIQVQDDADLLEALRLSSAKTVQALEGRFPLPNLIELMTQMLQHTSPPMYLTRGTLLNVFRGLKSKQAAMDNPQEFATAAARVLKTRLADQLVDGIKYTKLGEVYEMTQFDAEIESWERYLVPAAHGLYDHAVVDSDTERKFVEDLEKRDDVLLYVKLPGWFKVRTPIGEYNPDWALVMEDRDEHGDPTGKPLLYLVRETKSTHDRQKLRPDERRKITCGERHFVDTLDVDYKIVVSAGELP